MSDNIKPTQNPRNEALKARPFVPDLDPERPRISIETIYKMGDLFGRKSFGSPEIKDKARAANAIVRFIYYDDRWGDEEPWVTINCKVDPVEVILGPNDLVPDVALKMHGDIAHRFWMQKLNLMFAITRRLVIVKGSLPAVARLVPIVRPSFPKYRETLRELGLIDLLNHPKSKNDNATADEKQTDAPIENTTD